MQVIVESEKRVWRTDEMVVVRVLVLNDSYEPVAIDRRWLVGPNLLFGIPRMPPPINVEPALASEAENQVVLNPWCVYGRQRSFGPLPLGPVTLHGYLLNRLEDALLPTGPGDPAALLAAAVPLELTIVDNATPVA
jgi:hypothetical protein